MNGLTLLGLILGGLIAWWAAWALVHGGTRKPTPERRVYRDRWDDR